MPEVTLSRFLFFCATLSIVFSASYAEPENPKEYEKRMALTAKAVSGNVTSMHSLGVYFQLKQEYTLASSWFEKAGKKKNAQSYWSLIDILYRKTGNIDYPRIRDIYLELLQFNDPSVHTLLGDLYSSPTTGLQDLKQAKIHYLDGAASKESSSMVKLGLLYMGTNGHERIYRDAVRWLEQAQKLENVVAMRYLGLCFRYGLGVKEDHATAWKYYAQAAEKNDRASLFALAEALYYGDHVQKDLPRAQNYFRRAAEGGHREAKIQLKKLDFTLSSTQQGEAAPSLGTPE